MRRGLVLLCLLASVSVWAQQDMMKEAADLLTLFLSIVDSKPPTTGRECYALIRRPRQALEDFKSKYPSALPDIVKDLEGAGFTFERGCRSLDQFGNLALWPAGTQLVTRADEAFYKLTEKTAPPPKPAAPPAEKPAEPTAPAPTPPTLTAPEAAGALLSKFFTLADAQPPRNQNDCLNLLRPAEQGLEQFKSAYPGQLPELVEALARAASGYAQVCRSSSREASAWAGASENVHMAEQLLAKAAGKPVGGPAAVPAGGSQPGPTAAPAGTPGVNRAALERAKAVVAQVQKLDSVMDLALGKEQSQERLIEAHAGLQEFASSPESEALPLTVANLRLALAYYRRRLDAEDSFARASAKEALLKARTYLKNYEETGQEEPPQP